MIVIKIELWPYGIEDKAREISRAYIVNDIETSHRTKGKFKSYNASFLKPNAQKVWKKGKADKVHRTKKNVWDILYLCLRSAGMERRNK